MILLWSRRILPPRRGCSCTGAPLWPGSHRVQPPLAHAAPVPHASMGPSEPKGAPKLSPEEIAARVAASRKRRSAHPCLRCPACSVGLGTPQALQQHLASCCPDLMAASQPQWAHVVGLERTAATAALVPLLTAAEQQEQQLRKQAIELTFRTGEQHPDGDQPGRLPRSEVARRMGLPERRVAELLSRGMRAYPMPADPEPVEVLLEDDGLLAVNKPSGVNTAPAHRYTGGSMVNRLIHHLGHPPYVIHRLDMHTSGVLLFAKTLEAVKAVARQFRARTVSKWYLAVCIGVPDTQRFEVRTLIARHPTVAVGRVTLPLTHAADGVSMATSSSSFSSVTSSSSIVASDRSAGDLVAADSGSSDEDLLGPSDDSSIDGDEGPGSDAKEAWTSCFVVSTNPRADLASLAQPGQLFTPSHMGSLQGVSLIACRPHTGRTHQIRVHCQSVGHPIVGDGLYGVEGPWIPRLALHASALRVQHPGTGEPLLLGAPLPQDMLEAVEALGLQAPVPQELPALLPN